MNCPNCGTSNLDNATICANCGRPLSATYTPPPPPPASSSYTPPPSGGAMAPGTIPNYLIPSIILTVCCCPPLGVVAIIFSAQVNSKLAVGDVAGAQEASKKAKLFMLIGFGIDLAVAVLYAVLMGLGFAGAIFENMGR